MADVSSISQDQLRERRRSLRRQRRLGIAQILWQVLALSGLTAGVFWGATRPVWFIRSADQILVEGNQLLSDEAIRSLVTIDYPKPLLQLKPDVIVQQLETRAPIVQASVERHLLPPTLEIRVEERIPVAIALPPTTAPNPEVSYIQLGFIDAEGVWIPQSSFTLAEDAPELPALKVRGMQEEYRPYWPELYQAILQSPVKITELDWQDSNNLILHTELGLVHIGLYTDRFMEKLVILDQMRNLTGQVDRKQIAYIDLSDPEMPSVQMLQVDPPKPKAP